MTKRRQDNNVTDLTRAVYAEKESEQSWKIKQDVVCDESQTINDMTIHIRVVNDETKIELSWLIKTGANCGEN